MEVSKEPTFYMIPLKLLLKVELKSQSRTEPGVLGNDTDIYIYVYIYIYIACSIQIIYK